MDGLGRVFGFEEEQLSNNDVGSIVGDRAVDANDSLFKEAREDVVSPLSSGRVLDHHGYNTV